MKIPTSLKIGAHHFKVITNEENPSALGETDWEKGTIKIDASVIQSVKEATLIHEIFHVMNSTLGGQQYGHALIDSLSEQFYAVLKENNLLKK